MFHIIYYILYCYYIVIMIVILFYCTLHLISYILYFMSYVLFILLYCFKSYIIGWTLTWASSCCCVPLRFFFSARLLMTSERSCWPAACASCRPAFSLNLVLVTVCLSFAAFVSLSFSAYASAGGNYSRVCHGHSLLELRSLCQSVLFCLHQCRWQSLYNRNPKPGTLSCKP